MQGKGWDQTSLFCGPVNHAARLASLEILPDRAAASTLHLKKPCISVPRRRLHQPEHAGVVERALEGLGQHGARQVECTINGIGERAGNCALEELAVAFKVRADKLPYETKIVTEGLYPASQLLTSIITFGPQPNKAIVGENAFAHEAGIHQDGYLKHKSTYEIIEPNLVGVPESRLVLGKHSGRHALNKRCEDLGFQLTKEQLVEVYTKFTTLADRKKGVRNDEILSIIREAVGAKQPVAGD